MKIYSGNISKLVVKHAIPVSYALPIGEDVIPLNALIGLNIQMIFEQVIQCIACGRKIPKSFQQGYCFPCTRKLAQCDLCVLKPVLCHYHQGTCREPQWGDTHCMIPHVVYLSNTSGLKVGLTRENQIPTRWIDQGAVSAVPLYTTKTRRIAGYIEAEMSKTMKETTQWQKMLKNIVLDIDLAAERKKILSQNQKILKNIIKKFGPQSVEEISDAQIYQFEYPVIEYPEKVRALSFDKTPTIEGILKGIKGQYLLLDSGVLNIRKFSGYQIQFIPYSSSR